MKQGGRVRKREMRRKQGQRCHAGGFDGGRRRKPRNDSGLWKLEKARKWVLPSSLQIELALLRLWDF